MLKCIPAEVSFFSQVILCLFVLLIFSLFLLGQNSLTMGSQSHCQVKITSEKISVSICPFHLANSIFLTARSSSSSVHEVFSSWIILLGVVTSFHTFSGISCILAHHAHRTFYSKSRICCFSYFPHLPKQSILHIETHGA